MSLIRINTSPSRRQLNVFGGLWLVFVGVLAAIAYLRFDRPTVAWMLAGFAIAVPVVGWASPRVMRLVYVGMAYAALPIGLVVSFLSLTLLYFLIMTPIGLAIRAAGRDPMHRKSDASASTYWEKRPVSSDRSRAFKQY